jgi:hypothetical protein
VTSPTGAPGLALILTQGRPAMARLQTALDMRVTSGIFLLIVSDSVKKNSEKIVFFRKIFQNFFSKFFPEFFSEFFFPENGIVSLDGTFDFVRLGGPGLEFFSVNPCESKK